MVARQGGMISRGKKGNDKGGGDKGNDDRRQQ